MDLHEACKYIRSLLGNYYNPNKTMSQLAEFKTKGLSYEDICERVSYWYEVRKGEPSKSQGGIGILNFIESEFQEWKNTQDNLQKVKGNLKDFKLDNNPSQIVHVKVDRTYKLPDSN